MDANQAAERMTADGAEAVHLTTFIGKDGQTREALIGFTPTVTLETTDEAGQTSSQTLTLTELIESAVNDDDGEIAELTSQYVKARPEMRLPELPDGITAIPIQLTTPDGAPLVLATRSNPIILEGDDGPELMQYVPAIMGGAYYAVGQQGAPLHERVMAAPAKDRYLVPDDYNSFLIADMQVIGTDGKTYDTGLYSALDHATTPLQVRDVLESIIVDAAIKRRFEDAATSSTEGGVIIPEIPTQCLTLPRTHYAPISKLANSITNPQLFSKAGARLDVAGRGEARRGKKVATMVSLSWDDVNLSRPITEFDQAIHESVSSLWAAGNRVFTPQQVWKVSSGDKGSPTRAQLDATIESLDAQRSIKARVDYTAEARERNLKIEGNPITSYTIDGHLIEARKTELRTANGAIVSGYELSGPPILYQHAAALEQITVYPQRLLERVSAGRNSRVNIALRSYTLRRIGQMKNRRRKSSNVIRLETIYERVAPIVQQRAGLTHTELNKEQKADLRKAFLKLLDTMITAGHIRDYRTIREGRSVVSVEIKV